jgi:alkanesulfonate monooxygenase SsuD/methylene tetrahydromethanopterin reductase-like flavin-dependent oxidoreductase (luciferase family)
LLIGGGEQMTLKLVAQYGDACNVGVGDLATIEHKFAVLKRHCEAVGRDYQSIHRTAGTICIIGDTDEQALAKLPAVQRVRFGNAINVALVGSLETLHKRIAAYEAVGVQELQITFTEPDAIRRFAKEFIV